MTIAQPPDAFRSAAPTRPEAKRLTTDAEALAAAHAVADQIAVGAAERDRERRLPYAEADIFSSSGLWALQVPAEFGGPALSSATVAKVFTIIAEADPSIAQLAQNHYCFVEHIARLGSPEQKNFFLDRILKGDRLGNGFSEKGGKHVRDISTRLTRAGERFRLNGEKFYTTGAIFADWIPIGAIGPDDKPIVAILPRGAQGLEIVDDWSGFGQRTTASGTLRLVDVEVQAEQLIDTSKAYEKPSAAGPYAQINHVAIDVGIASAAIRDTIAFVRDRARPWIDAGVERASEDPYVIREVGDLIWRFRAAELLLERAANLLDAARAEPTEDTVAEASLATAEARIASDQIAIAAGNKLFELAGTRSVAEAENLNRHWRNARVHTLHDPVRWKFHAIGNFHLNGVKPPRHPWI